MKRHSEDPGESKRKVRRTEERPQNIFQVTPIDSLYSEVLPSFRQPSEVGYFCLDVDRKFYDDNHQLKYFHPPHTINFDLRAGYKEYLERDDDVKEHLDHLLMWVDKHRAKFELSKDSVENGQASSSQSFTSLNTDFITWRGHLTKLLVTPYETREPWKFAATLYKGTIYICEIETREAYERRKNMEEKHKEMCYWGHKFETYVCRLVSEKLKRKAGEATCTARDAACSARDAAGSARDAAGSARDAAGSAGDAAGSSAATSKKDTPVNNSEGFVSVIRTRLEKHSLVFGAEVDCCTKETEQSPGNYIELKTSNQPHNHHQHRSFKRYKLLKWWAQSYLAGIPKIICGFRHHHGQVNELQTYNTLEIPRMVRHDDNMWDMNICLSFLNKFLDWVKMVVAKEDPKKVYIFSFKAPFENITFEECDSDENSFLPEWYTKET